MSEHSLTSGSAGEREERALDVAEPGRARVRPRNEVATVQSRPPQPALGLTTGAQAAGISTGSMSGGQLRARAADISTGSMGGGQLRARAADISTGSMSG